MSQKVDTEKIEKFHKMVDTPDGDNVSEFTMTDTWHDRLRDLGCFEIVDRKGVLGYALSPEFAQSLIERVEELEEQVKEG